MSQLNSMPLYTDAYLADTMHLSLEEHGAYLKLLIVMWRNGGSLPDDDAKVSRYLGVSIGKWTKLKPVIGEFFSYDGEDFTQKKLQETFTAMNEKFEKNRERGSEGGKAKARKYKESPLADAKQTLDENTCLEPSERLANHKPYTIYSKEDKSSSEVGASASADDHQKLVSTIFDWITAKFNSPSVFYHHAPIEAWLGWGADFEKDIKPAVERHIAKGKNVPRSLAWLDENVAASIKQRNKPMPEVSARAVTDAAASLENVIEAARKNMFGEGEGDGQSS